MTDEARVLSAFSLEQAASLTGIHENVLASWDRTSLFEPEYVVDRRRVYSFRDLVGLRVIARLKASHVSTQQLRRVAPRLREERDHPWSSLRLFVIKGVVHFMDSESSVRDVDGQLAFDMMIDVAEVRATLERDLRERSIRSDDHIGVISQNRDVMRNSPVVAGTRITTRAIWEFHEAGFSEDEILAQYPRLTVNDVRAAIAAEGSQRKTG